MYNSEIIKESISFFANNHPILMSIWLNVGILVLNLLKK